MNHLFSGRAKQKRKSTHSYTSSNSSRISAAVITNIIERLKSERFRDFTRCTYHKIWKLFGKFYIQLDEKPNNLEDKIVFFAAFLIENQLQSVTVKTYISAIRSVLVEDGIRLNKDKFLLTSLTRASRLKNDRVSIRLPIYKDLLLLILEEVNKHYSKINQPFLSILHQAMFSSAYFGLLHAG